MRTVRICVFLFVFIPPLFSLIFLAAKLARDLAILPFSGHDAPKSTKNKTVCVSQLFLWSFIGHLFFGSATSAIVSLCFVSKINQTRKGK